jgi:hypothetical protein
VKISEGVIGFGSDRFSPLPVACIPSETASETPHLIFIYQRWPGIPYYIATVETAA